MRSDSAIVTIAKPTTPIFTTNMKTPTNVKAAITMNPSSSCLLRQRHNTHDRKQQAEEQVDVQTAADFQADSMFNNLLDKEEEVDIYKQTNLHSGLINYQRHRHKNNFDTYPPKRNNSKKLQRYQRHQSNSLSTSNILQTTTLKRTMSSRNSPLRNLNTGRVFTKGSFKRSFSESSAEQLQRYTTSDSCTSQEEDELMLRISEKRKLSRRSLGSGLYKNQHQSKRHSQFVDSATGADDDESAFGCSTIFGKHSQWVSDMIDIGIRVVLVVVFSKLETQTAFKRIIHSEEMWRYKNPRTKDYVSPLALLLAVIFGPFFVTLIHLTLTKDRRDFRAASWAWTLILGLNGLTTSLLKISVGRPRPDFFYRCFPDGIMQLSHNGSTTDNMLDLFNCTGNLRDINEGRKSFPSGHSSFAFAGFGFITYYVGAKLRAFNRHGRGESWRLCISVTPLVLAALIAVSRTCDYHHHWEDVTIGSLIGLFVSYYIYRQYYPSIFSLHCYKPYPRGINLSTKTMKEHFAQTRSRRRLQSYKRVPSEECGEASLLCESPNESFLPDIDKQSLLNEQKTGNKWF